MDFQEADRRYTDLKQQYDNGNLSAEEFQAQLREIMVQDGEGRWWSKHPETGEWHYYDGAAWIQGVPPANEEVTSYPPPDRPPTETAPGRPGRRLLVAAVIAAALLVGIGSTVAVVAVEGGGPPTVTIVSDLPLQGSGGPESEAMVNAITLALEERNNKAGDVQINYVSQDDATEQDGKWTEDQCKKNANSAAQDEQTVGWIGPFNSGCAQVEIPSLNNAELGPVAMVSPANTAVGLTKKGGESDEPDKYYPTGKRNYARVIVADDQQGRAAALWMKGILGVKSVYILHDGETYGQGLADQFQKNAKQQGIDILGNEKIDPKAANYRSLMDQIAQDKPDAIYFGGITENGAPQLVKDKIRAGMSNDKVIFMGADGITDNEFLRLAGDQGEGVYVTFPGLPPKLLPDKGQAFVERYQERFPDTKIEATSANAYEAANVLLDAIQRAYEKDGEVTREGVVRELFATKDYDGVLGTWSFDSNGDTSLTKLAGRRVNNGDFTLNTDRAIDVAVS